MLTSFLVDCSVRGRTNRTIETYKSNIGEFLKYYPEPEEVTKHDLRNYLQHLQRRGLCKSVLSGCFQGIKRSERNY
ncbi:phage integrase N-terminal SAM-like domain-containing protein [Methanolobus sp. ZRKC3]|uniref:phage integrase N-terminal SAM-like domain-containing protein n=1 Tax=Methanolobus sp. ZRKC3 TaxID=3125786 RepID=UPI003872E868